MGLSRTVYLGPYLECRPSPAPPWPVDPWEASGAIKEALHAADVAGSDIAFWLPNARRPGRPRAFDAGEDGAVKVHGGGPTPGIDVGGEMGWFERAYAGEIRTLRGMYGAESVSVAWGLIAYTN